MTPEEFIEELKKEIKDNEIHFIDNMKNLNMKKDTFSEWFSVYWAWMKWVQEQDMRRIEAYK